eukprot:INCI2383.1.p1 GENE.INCI2383.1~~INCI2383.1.p1  ORF type:complete len:475 (-),score=52.78 INCI2383.1:115-1539(-)
MPLPRWCTNPSFDRCISLSFFVVGLQLTVILFLFLGSGNGQRGNTVALGTGRAMAQRSESEPWMGMGRKSGTPPNLRGNLNNGPGSAPRKDQQQRAQQSGPQGGRGGDPAGNNKWKFEQPEVHLELTQKCSQRPLVIGGFTGSGTRLPMRILQRAGVFMGPDRLISDDGDTLAWIRSMAGKSIHDQIKFLLSKTGSPSYSIEADLLPESADLVADVDQEFQTFKNYWENELADHFLTGSEHAADEVQSLCQRSQDSFGWGWKGPRQMWFLPFIERHFPNFHFIYAVRDVRDLLNPHTSFTEHDVYWVDSFFRGKGEEPPRSRDGNFQHAGIAQMWAEASLAVLHWCEEPAQKQAGRCTIVLPQTLGGQEDALPRFLDDVGIVPEDTLVNDLRKNVLGACLGSSSKKSSQHKCDQSSTGFSANYRAWSRDDFYAGSNSARCAEYATLMQVPYVEEALEALGFDSHFVPQACASIL